MVNNYDKKNTKKLLDSKKEQNIEQLYVNYINTLVKTENLQNKLEKVCSTMISKPKYLPSKKTRCLNNYVNNMMVKVMVMQNLINYISTNKKA